MNNKCLYCYGAIGQNELNLQSGKAGFHKKCSNQFFGTPNPPDLDFTENQILDLAEQVIKRQKTITGVQPKLSLGLSKNATPKRLTIVGLWGEYILKPQTEMYANLPENEDLTMHLAELSKIKTVKHSLIRLKTGQMAYITKRVDRKNGHKLHMEDMCQLTERLTEHKYKGSYEQIAKAIKKYSANPGLDLTCFYELVVFGFLTGNNDMHLKNFSLLKKENDYVLCPAYDLLASELVVEGDDEELALTLNGKKKKLKKTDFVQAMKGSGLDDKVIANILGKYEKMTPKWMKFIDNSFLPKSTIEAYKELLLKKSKQLGFKILKEKG